MVTYKKDSPRFDGTNYSLWKNCMECYLRCIGEPYQDISKDKCIIPTNGPSTPNEIKSVEYFTRAKKALLSSLIDFEMTNIMELQTAHEIQKKWETLYEGDSYVKIYKLQSLKGKYEMLRMGEDENIISLMLKVNELVCNIRCAGGKLEESEIAKVIRSLLASYKHKVPTIEEIRTMTDVTKDMLIGKLSTFELSEFGDYVPKVGSAFKAIVFRKDKKRYNLRESSSWWMSKYEKERNEIKEEEQYLEVIVAKRLAKGVGKYEGKLRLKCFSCNKTGHFASRCLERVPRKPYKPKFHKRCYYAADEGVSDDESGK